MVPFETSRAGKGRHRQRHACYPWWVGGALGHGSSGVHGAQDFVSAGARGRDRRCHPKVGRVAKVERMGGKRGHEEGGPGDEGPIQKQQEQSGLGVGVLSHIERNL